ncbi:MAG: glutamine synthetase type III, partial [Butyrivibrio sp.]|nr:glutamine synthetase type III [Butyrivibrio sp.]
QNAQFLLFLAAFVKGVDEYQDTLRCTVASAGNDHRLGAQEAPPAIISIFLGDELEAVVESIISGKPYKDGGKKKIEIGIDVLPSIPQDNTDRNRTSPMAFTGNKFEFRMLGSAQSISGPNIALNTIMAQELKEFADKLEKSKNFNADLQKLIKKTFTEHQRIIFNGNGYDESWVKEATKRGLSNLVSTADALPHYADKKAVDLYVGNGVYTAGEIEARALIHAETYGAKIAIEANTMLDMIRRQILPAVSSYAADLCDRMATLKAAGCVTAYETDTSKEVAVLTDALMKQCQKLAKDMSKVPADPWKAMEYYHKTIIADMDAARKSADALELLVDEQYWPFPVYSDLLFSE